MTKCTRNIDKMITLTIVALVALSYRLRHYVKEKKRKAREVKLQKQLKEEADLNGHAFEENKENCHDKTRPVQAKIGLSEKEQNANGADANNNYIADDNKRAILENKKLKELFMGADLLKLETEYSKEKSILKEQAVAS